MTSQIDITKPSSGQALTADVRKNFGYAHAEITDLQQRIALLEASHVVSLTVENETLNEAVVNGGVLRFDRVRIDTDGFVPTTMPIDIITIPAGLGGLYLLVATSSGSGTQSTTLGMGILVNGSQVFSHTNQSISGPQSVAYTLDNGAVEMGRLSAGDTLQLRNNSVSAGPNVFLSTTMALARIGP
jgi:hypothetical protein